MIIDNLVVNAIKKELSHSILNYRIDKIFQIGKYDFLLTLFNRGVKMSLIISLNPNIYRLHLTGNQYKDSKQLSSFCLQLKKNLESGTIVEIKQINFDRILSFKIENLDNVRDPIIFYLIVELTGKYSNLILTDENNKILGSYKQIDETQNEERQILVGTKYCPITNKQNKLDLNDLSKEKFASLIQKYPTLSLKKFLINCFTGISSHTCTLLFDDLPISLESEQKLDSILQIPLKNFPENLLDQIFIQLSQFSETIREDNIFLKFTEINNLLSFKLDTKISEVSKVLDKYYFNLESQNVFNNLKSEQKKVINKNIEKINNKLLIQQNILESSHEADKNKQYGELLLSNIHNLPEYTDSVTIDNFYNNNYPENIKLDKNLTISENAQIFFKKYNKLKNSREVSLKIIEELKQELVYLEEVDISVDNSENIEDLKEIEAELILETYILKKEKNTKKTSALDKNNLLLFKSIDGFDILIGKNNSQNDYLTTKLALENDIWLHTRLIPGSHVIIRTNNGQKIVSDKTLLEAATYAAKYSKAKYSSNVCVIYTKIKYVKKPPHSKPGFVIYSHEKAIYVTP